MTLDTATRERLKADIDRVRRVRLRTYAGEQIALDPERFRQCEAIQEVGHPGERCSLAARPGLSYCGSHERIRLAAPEPEAAPEREISERVPFLETDRGKHSYKEPVPGFCLAFVDLGPSFQNRVRCSFRAPAGESYCGGHARKYEPERFADEPRCARISVTTGSRCRRRPAPGSEICRTHTYLDGRWGYEAKREQIRPGLAIRISPHLLSEAEAA